MLNIFKEKINKKNRLKKQSSDNNNNTDYNKNFPPAHTEWSNSVYAYNKNYLKSLPIYNLITTNLIKNYFNFFNPDNERNTQKKMSRRMRIRLKRLSINQVFVNKTKLKHTSSKIIVISNIFNPIKLLLAKKLSKLNNKNKRFEDTKANALVSLKSSRYYNWIIKDQIDHQIRLLGLYKDKKVKIREKKIRRRIIKNSIFYNWIMQDLKKDFYFYLLDKKQDLNTKYVKLFNVFKSKVSSKYKNVWRWIHRIKRDKIDIKNKISFENSKYDFSKTYLLKKLINKIYGKQIDLNITNLKYVYLNSDIVADSVSKKLKKNRRSPLRVLRKFLRKIKLPLSSKYDDYDANISYRKSLIDKLKTYNLNSFLTTKISNSESKDVLNQLLQEIYMHDNNEETKKNLIFDDTYNKAVKGIRVEASGRLSKRLKASRSRQKIKYKGSLRNTDSSERGLSAVMLRNYAKSNIQYTKQNSKTRNGSFGLKVWVSSK